MASLPILITIAIVAVVAPPALATDFVVGDDKGWTTNFDYQAWAMGKEFRVGDKLIFKYTSGAHNVHRVDGTGFQQCLAPPTSQALTSGNDEIPLTAAGRKWYICGVGKHCELGNQKLAITVLPQLGSPASSPSNEGPSSTPTSAASGIDTSKHVAWMMAAFGVMMMIMV
ncbi:hypothetical protein F0562_012984 [Nyssa sinensis]|uniref:Phytocyanin domain-containing protein n=1 Tax=Nyssa sinensis TaxID=561372 RepID=A0A5J4ZYZ4_9ASTE|nr:hypothetical protein F0562_012984 [Nyssa sinensis]